MIETSVESGKFWKVDIDAFEGPLDLLLYLIRKNNMDIYDIPIAQITSEYLKYIDVIKYLHLDNVGDFLVMASMLMNIKSRTLLPSEDPVEEGEDSPARQVRSCRVEEIYGRAREPARAYRAPRAGSGVYK